MELFFSDRADKNKYPVDILEFPTKPSKSGVVTKYLKVITSVI